MSSLLPPVMSARTKSRRFVVLNFALILLAVALTYLLIRGIGFVSDDFYLLVEDLRLPLTQSADGMQRPLRNLLFKALGTYIGVQDLWPYRLLVACSYTAVLALLFRFLRRFGVGRPGALAAVLVMAFFPRNEEVLFWFAAWQDMVAAICILLTCIWFLDFRESGRSRNLVYAALTYLAALGFKENIIVIPAVLVLLDFYRTPSVSLLKERRFWRAYIPFAGVFFLYVVVYFSDAGVSRLTGQTTQGYYGFPGPLKVLLGLVRALINIALPFYAPMQLGFHDIHFRPLALLSLEALALLLVVWRLKQWSSLLFASGWVILTLLPTATFASTLYADRFLFVPTIGAALLAGLLVHSFRTASSRARYVYFIGGALALYSVSGLLVLEKCRQIWHGASAEAAAVVAGARTASAGLGSGGELDLVNESKSFDRYPPCVFCTGLRGALEGRGISSNLKIIANFASDESSQQGLIGRIRRCPVLPSSPSDNRAVLVTIDHRPVQFDSTCAGPLVDADRASRSHAWSVINSRK